MSELNFKHDLILVIFNQAKFEYDTYDVMKFLSVNYQTVCILIEELLEEELITKEPIIQKFKLTKEGNKHLYDKYLNNINLDELKNLLNEDITPDFKPEELLYIP